MIALIRKIVFPFSLLYGGIVALRNQLYFSGVKKRFHVPKKSIVVGNLSVGGTGKTPMIAYLLELFSKENIDTHVISRGYGRTTKGYRSVEINSSPNEVGDEPLLLKKKFPKANFSVCEERKKAVEMIEKKASPSVYLFDDAFQHLAIQAERNILLTTFQSPYFKDFMLPTGNLREFSSGRKRADIVIVTKCPNNLDEKTKETYRKQLDFPKENCFFSSIKYEEITPFSPKQNPYFNCVLLVTGIANSSPLENYLSEKYEIQVIKYADHHIFTREDIVSIQQKFDTFASEGNGIILTTEKDFVKLSQERFQDMIHSHPWNYLPISVEIDRKEEFEQKIIDYVAAI